MRIMIFYDLRNFEGALKDCGRVLQVGRVHYFLIDKINYHLNLQLEHRDLVRAYAYTGEYTVSFIKKVKDAAEKEQSADRKKKITDFLQYVEKEKDRNDRFKELTWSFHFFELKTLPLRYNAKSIEGYQKGVDVELAVDLVSFAYKDAYDIAVVCSGDSDLQRSMDQVKSLGKRVILMSHPRCMSNELKKCADYFIDISKMTEKDLDAISRKYIPYSADETHSRNNGTCN